MRIHKNDTVQVLAGKDKGKTGKVVRAFPAQSKVVVEGINLQTRHEKAKRNTKQGGGIVSVAAPVSVSNVALVDPKSSKPTRVGVKRNDAGKNVRYTKKSGTVLK